MHTMHFTECFARRWNAALDEQAESRVHRIGQVDSQIGLIVKIALIVKSG